MADSPAEHQTALAQLNTISAFVRSASAEVTRIQAENRRLFSELAAAIAALAVSGEDRARLVEQVNRLIGEGDALENAVAGIAAALPKEGGSPSGSSGGSPGGSTGGSTSGSVSAVAASSSPAKKGKSGAA